MIKPLSAACIFLTFAAAAMAADWPQFRGPNRDDISKETGLLKEWPDGGPKLVWHAKGLGGGYSSLSVVGDRIYTLGNHDKLSKVMALSRGDGKVVWSAEVGPAGGNLGCTPTVEGDRIYALGQEGDLVCLKASDGERVWHRHLQRDFDGSVGGWHYCESPLVDGDHVIVTPGGKESTMVALDKKSGETVWKCAIPFAETPQAGYSSIVVADVGGIRQYVQLLDSGLVGVSADGKSLWVYEKLGHNTANIPTPIVLKDEILSIAGYGKGGALLKLKADGNDVKAEEVYFNHELTNKHGGVVVVGDHIFCDADDHGRPLCAEVKTGKILWKRKGGDGHGQGSASVTYADGRLYFHYDDGTIALVEPSPEGYKENGWFKNETDGPGWSHPVVSGRQLYIREGNTLYRYDLREKP